MRTAPWLCLPVAALLAGLGASDAFAKVTRAEAARQPVLKREFTGYGTDLLLAQQHALAQARDWLAEEGPFDWTPPPEYLRQKGLVSFSAPTEQELKLAGPMKVVKMDLTVTAGQAEEIQKVARQHRMTQRQWLLGRVLVGLVALLLVAGGYLRLEEATRGYYTTLLRAAALTVLALVGAGLWLLEK
jgi:hypothetical protein